MELSSSDIKKTPVFFQKKDFLIFIGNGAVHFSAQAQKNKKIHPEKISYTSGNKNPEKTYIFSKESFSYILENRNPEKILDISGSSFQSSKNGKKIPLLKCFLYFEKWNFATSLKPFFYFRKELTKP